MIKVILINNILSIIMSKKIFIKATLNRFMIILINNKILILIIDKIFNKIINNLNIREIGRVDN